MRKDSVSRFGRQLTIGLMMLGLCSAPAMGQEEPRGSDQAEPRLQEERQDAAETDREQRRVEKERRRAERNQAETPRAQRRERAEQPEQAGGEKDTQSAALGVMVAPSPRGGVLVLDVHPESPAAQAGLRFGDYILAVGETEIASPEELTRHIKEHKPGDEVSLKTWRNGKEQTVTATLSSRGEEFGPGAEPEPEGERNLPRLGGSDREEPGTGDARRRESRRAESDDRPWLGILLQQPEEEDATGGARVARIFPGGPAAQAGLRSGDVIRRANGQPIEHPDDLVGALEGVKPGDEITLAIERNEEEREIRLEAGSRPGRPFGEPFPGEGRFGPPFGERPPGVGPFGDMPRMMEPQGRMAERQEQIESLLRQLVEEVGELRKEVRQLREDRPGTREQQQPQ